jgi:hypothetical protein
MSHAGAQTRAIMPLDLLVALSPFVVMGLLYLLGE